MKLYLKVIRVSTIEKLKRKCHKSSHVNHLKLKIKLVLCELIELENHSQRIIFICFCGQNYQSF